MSTAPLALARAAWKLISRNKLVSSVTAVFIVFAVVVVSSAGSGAPPARQASPMAPDFTVALLSQQAPGQHSPGQSGQHVTLSARYRNKPVIVNFWASWCDPCQQETPLLAGWHRRHPAVNLIGIDENDSAASAEKFAKAKGVTYLLGFDPRITVASAFGVQGAGIPQTFFLNARHQIVDRAYGALTEAGLNRGLRLMNP